MDSPPIFVSTGAGADYGFGLWDNAGSILSRNPEDHKVLNIMFYNVKINLGASLEPTL